MDADKVAQHVLRVYREVDNALTEIPKHVKVSCKRGCTGCCYQLVALQFEEAVSIAQYVVTSSSSSAVQKLLATLDEQSKALKARRRTREELFLDRKPCAFLVEDDCSIYKVRPLVCRAHFVVSDPALCAPDRTYDCSIVDVRQLSGQAVAKINVQFNMMGPLQPLVAEAIRCLVEEREPSVLELDGWRRRFSQMLSYDRAQMAQHGLEDHYVKG